MSYQWNWELYLNDRGDDTTYLNWLLSAWQETIQISLMALVVALFFGVVVGTLRTLPDSRWPKWGNVWVELFRNIPLLLQIFLWYHVLPAIFQPLKALSPFLLAAVGLGLFTSARIAEQVKAGILALPRGQRWAALALGLNQGQAYRYVILPMSFRIILPPLTSECMNIIKNSAAAFAVSLPVLSMFSLQAQEETARLFEIYLPVTGLYMVSAFFVYFVLSYIENRLRVPGMIGGKK